MVNGCPSKTEVLKGWPEALCTLSELVDFYLDFATGDHVVTQPFVWGFPNISVWRFILCCILCSCGFIPFFLISLPFQWDLSRGKKSLSWMYSITFVTVNVSFWGIGSSHTSCVSWILCSYQQVNQLSEIKCIPLSFPPLFLQSSHWIEPTWGFSLVSLTSWTQRTVFICENLLTPSSFFLL